MRSIWLRAHARLGCIANKLGTGLVMVSRVRVPGIRGMLPTIFEVRVSCVFVLRFLDALISQSTCSNTTGTYACVLSTKPGSCLSPNKLNAMDMYPGAWVMCSLGLKSVCPDT